MKAFEVDEAAVMDLAAQKLADQIADDSDIRSQVERTITRRIDDAMKAVVNEKIDRILSAQLEKMLSVTVQPVTMWGEKTGEPTTIAEALSARAKDFWDTKVDSNGRPVNRDSYNYRDATTRAEYLVGKVMAEDFIVMVRQNATGILLALKDKLREDAVASVTKHLDELIRVRGR